MTDDPVTEPAASLVEVVLAGHRRDTAAARRAMGSPDARVRVGALGALERSGSLRDHDVAEAAADPSAAVRRRACELAATRPPGGVVARALGHALDDPDLLVVEAACWALGERGVDGVDGAVGHVASVAASHPDARAREAAVAALGALGDPAGLPAVLAALGDRPTVRRRAVVALAAFEGDEVTAAIRQAATDRDWQVREVAEILLDE